MTSDLGEHLRIIWRRKWLVLLLSLLLAGGVYWLSSQQDETYAADLRLRLAAGQAATGQQVGENDTAFLAESYAELATTRAVQDATAEAVDPPVTRKTVERRVSIDAAATAGFIDVRATGPTPERAEELATAMGEALSSAVQTRQRELVEAATVPLEEELESLEDRLEALTEDSATRDALTARYEALVTALTQRQLQAVDRLEIVSPAVASDDPVSPRPRRDALLAFLVGFIVYSELFVLAAALGDRFSSETLSEDIERVAGVPVLARIPQRRPDDIEEAFRELRTNLQFMAGIGGVRSVAVIGNATGIGKTMTSLSIARSFASTGIPTVLIDGDLRRPSVHNRLDMSRSPGLTDYLQDQSVSMLRRTGSDNGPLGVITSGSPMANPSDVLTLRFGEVLAQTRPAELVVVDTPPLDLFADGLAVASQCDLTIVVIDVRSTRKRALRSTAARLKQVDANLVGVVANRVEGVPRSGSYYDTSTAEANAAAKREQREQREQREPAPKGSRRRK